MVLTIIRLRLSGGETLHEFRAYAGTEKLHISSGPAPNLVLVHQYYYCLIHIDFVGHHSPFTLLSWQ